MISGVMHGKFSSLLKIKGGWVYISQYFCHFFFTERNKIVGKLNLRCKDGETARIPTDLFQGI